MRANPVKAKFARGEVAVGTMVLEFNTTGIPRLAAEAGAEWILFDMEHTGWSTETVRTLMATARATDIVPVIRPPGNQPHLFSVHMDLGAMGVMAPMVETAEQTQAFVDAVKYPPLGRRGAAFIIAHDDYAEGDLTEKMNLANAESLTFALIETPLGVENVEEIAAVEGLDSLWVGHFDLTNFMGIAGQFDHEQYLDAVRHVISVADRHSKPVGIMVMSVENAKEMLDLGFRCLLYGGDLWLYQEALRGGVDRVRKLLGTHRPQPGGKLE